MFQDQEVLHKLAIYQQYVEEFGAERGEGADRKHSNRRWKTYRLAHQDYILGIRVVRAMADRYEIALFLGADHWKFEKGSGTIGNLIFCLSDAYHHTGTMELFFRGPQRGHEPSLETGFEPEIPKEVRVVAERYGVTLAHRHRIDDHEGRELYTRLTIGSEPLRVLLGQKGIDEVHAAFVLNRAILHRDSLAHLALYSLSPQRLIQGECFQENRSWFSHETQLLRIEIAMERLLVAFRNSNPDSSPGITGRWISRNEYGFTLNSAAKLDLGDFGTVEYQAQQEQVAVIAITDEEGYRFFFNNPQNWKPARSASLLVLCADWTFLSTSEEAAIRQKAEERKLRLFCLGDSLLEIDDDALKRLAQLQSTRRGIPEGRE